MIVSLKSIKSIQKILYFISFYINHWSSNFCSPSLFYWQNNNKKVWSNYMLFIVDCYRMKLVIYWSRCSSYRYNIYRSYRSSRQFTLPINGTLKLLALLLKLAIVLTDLTFIGLISIQGNFLHLGIPCSILSYIWAPMHLWLLDHLAISLDSCTISGLLYYQEGSSFKKISMEKLWYWHLKNKSNCV